MAVRVNERRQQRRALQIDLAAVGRGAVQQFAFAAHSKDAPVLDEQSLGIRGAGHSQNGSAKVQRLHSRITPYRISFKSYRHALVCTMHFDKSRIFFE